MDAIALISLLCGLFFVIAGADPIASKVRLPLAFVLCLIGAGVGLVALFVLQSPFATELGWEARRLLAFRIPSNFFLSVLLPVLIFQAALSLDIRRMFEDVLPIMVMAILAVVLATLAVGVALAPVSGLSLYACLLIGAIISTTDPSAVIDIFRSFSAPPRLVRIIQGESLLNDATAIALFSFFLAFVTAGMPNPEPAEILVSVPVMMLGGFAGGWLVTRLALPFLIRMAAWPLSQMTLSVVIPFSAFLSSEAAGFSGVIATFSAGLFLNLSAPTRLTPVSWRQIQEAWGLIAYWAGALIFLLAALLIPRLLQHVTTTDLGLVAIAMAATLASRAIVLWVLIPLMAVMRLSPVVSGSYRLVILWGGLRGAVTLALALAVTEAYAVPVEVKRAVGIIATGYVLSVFLIQGLTLRPLIAKLGLDRLTPIDQALSDQVIAVALQDVHESVSREMRDRGIDQDVFREEARRLGGLAQMAVEKADGANEVLASERVTLGLIAMAGHEHDLVLEAVRDGRIGAELQARMIEDSERVLEMARTHGRAGYRSAARMSIGEGARLRWAELLHRHLGVSAPLGALTSERIEVMIAQRAILEDLHKFVDARIRRIHGKRVTEILHEILTQRQENVGTLLEGLHIQYPEYTEDVGRRWVRRMALRLEAKEYDTLLAENLIVAEVHRILMKRIESDRRALSRRAKLDMGISSLALRESEARRDERLDLSSPADGR